MTHVLYKDLIPYDTPSSLGDLHGQGSGIVELPLLVHWGPQRVFDLANLSDTESAYQAIVREGTTKIQEALLNQAVLRQVWNDLTLPARCRQTWETRFPELTT